MLRSDFIVPCPWQKKVATAPIEVMEQLLMLGQRLRPALPLDNGLMQG